MKQSKAGQEAILSLMNRIHEELSGIEKDYKLLIGDGDFRPRIEHFHDAVRAFTAGDPAHTEAGGRLSIEWLSYDLRSLHYLQENPLAPLKPHSDANLSAMADVVKGGEGLLSPPKRPDRLTRDRISELYKNYGVLYAALLKPQADRDWHTRVGEVNEEVTQLSTLAAQFEAMTKGKGNAATVTHMAQNLQDDKLRKVILAFIQQNRHGHRQQLQGMVSAIREHIIKLDEGVLAVEEAHMSYSLAQLAIFEGAKEMIKTLASHGATLVGHFVAEAVAQAQRDKGREGR